MLATVKSAVPSLFSLSRLWQPALQPKMERPPLIGLCELPLELLTMILEELEWTDVLRVRQTCKAFQEISKARSIWLNLCRPHLFQTESAPQTLYLERHIHLYTSQELEFHFLRLKSAAIGFETDDGSPSRRREILTTSNSCCMHLVEGGRWLLVASETGSISYFDLEAPDPIETILIPHKFRGKSTTKVVMAIDYINDSSSLPFHLVVSHCLIVRRVSDPKEHMIHIWKVSLTVDDQQKGIGLSSELLASFPHELDIKRVWALSLRGPHLALSVSCPEYDELHRTFIIDWKQADGDSTNYRRRLLHPCYGPKTIHLLPDSRLFTVADEAIMLFDYSTIEETTSMPLPDHSGITAAPLWEKRDLNLRECGVSRPFLCSSSIRILFHGRGYLYGVIMAYPYDELFADKSVRLVTVMDFPPIAERHANYSIAYNRATIVDRHHQTYLISYTWPDEENHTPEPRWLHKEKTFMSCRFGPFFDEQSGRVVISSNQCFDEDATDDDSDSENLLKWHFIPDGPNVKFCHDVWDFALLYQ